MAFSCSACHSANLLSCPSLVLPFLNPVVLSFCLSFCQSLLLLFCHAGMPYVCHSANLFYPVLLSFCHALILLCSHSACHSANLLSFCSVMLACPNHGVLLFYLSFCQSHLSYSLFLSGILSCLSPVVSCSTQSFYQSRILKFCHSVMLESCCALVLPDILSIL
jgi:hypothetical protein